MINSRKFLATIGAAIELYSMTSHNLFRFFFYQNCIRIKSLLDIWKKSTDANKYRRKYVLTFFRHGKFNSDLRECILNIPITTRTYFFSE